jgi:hypothetical protein
MIKHIVLFFCVSILIIIGCYFATKIGFYYDEYLHAVSSQRILAGEAYKSDTPIAIKKDIYGRPVPLMILYYVGPLKTYFLTIPFAFFGSSILVLRSTTILLAALNLLLVFVFVKKNFTAKIALITILFLIFDTSYILSSVVDWGPIATQQLLKNLLLLLTFSLQDKFTQHKSKLFYVGIILSIIIWDKLNAIWIVIPTILFLIYQFYKERPIKLSLIGIISTGLLIGSIPLLIFVIKRPNFYQISQESFRDFEQYLITSADTASGHNLVFNYSSKIDDKLSTLTKTLNGNSIPNHILIHPINGGILSYIFYPFLVGWVIQTVIQLKSKKPLSNTNIITVFVCIIGIATLLTPNANGIHHMLLLWPLPQILVAATAAQFFKKSPVAITVIVVLVTLGNINTLYTFNLNLTESNSKIYWKREPIPELLNHLDTKKQYIALDWGISMPVAFLSNGKIAIKDLQPFYKPKCNELRSDPNTVYILHAENSEVFTQFRKKCANELSKFSIDETSAFTVYSSK